MQVVGAGQITIVDINDGLSASLSNYSSVLPASSAGAVLTYAGAETTFRIFEAGFDSSALWTFYVSATGGGVSYRDSDDGADRTGTGTPDGLLTGTTGYVRVVALTQDLSYLDITAVRSGHDSITQRFSVARSKAGVRGTIATSAATAGTSWVDATAAAAIASAGGGAPITGDVVALYNTGAGYAETRRYGGSSWAAVAAFFGGDVLVNGTVTAIKLGANSVTAGKIAANAIVAGDGAIANLAVTNGLIGNLAVDDAKIASMSVAKMTGGVMRVGAYMESTNYSSGASGSGFRINADGTAEMQAAYIRGRITADQFNGNGASINAPDGTPIFTAGIPVPETFLTQGQFQAQRAWNFNDTLEGWTAGNASLGTSSSYANLDATSDDPVLISPSSLLLYGPGYTKIRARIRRTAGSGWDGTAYYSTYAALPGYAGHDFDGGYRKAVTTFPVANNVWTVIEWDMSSLDAGGNDWATRTILQIRLDLGTGAADTFDIDWIAIGSTSPASYGAEFGRNVFGQITEATASTYIANAAISLAHIKVASIGSLSALTANIGLLRTRTAGARMELTGDVLTVFDDFGNIRVKIGNLA